MFSNRVELAMRAMCVHLCHLYDFFVHACNIGSPLTREHVDYNSDDCMLLYATLCVLQLEILVSLAHSQHIHRG